MLLLHEATILTCFYINLYLNKWSNLLYFFRSCLHPPSSIRITQCWFVNFFLSRAPLRRYVSSKVGPSFVEDIKIAAGFGGVRQYAGWLIFMYKVKLKIRFDILLGREGGFMKNVAVTFSVLKSIYEWPLFWSFDNQKALKMWM